MHFYERKATKAGNPKTINDKTQSSTMQLNNKMDRFYPPKAKITAFNDLFTCQLCRGYMINPTAIDNCRHTYCRSCIMRHLAGDSYCPLCKAHGSKALTISNLKSDEILRSIIFKLVPGLYQRERERVVQFVNNTKTAESFSNTVGGMPAAVKGKCPSSTSTSTSLLDFKDDFMDGEFDILSATDPISLSLEYHPYLARQCAKEALPPIRYLQCPASVKVMHLKRFLGTKFELDLNSKKVDIEIIYEDEVLPGDFTLMDVCYCYNWKRAGPLKFFYRILIYSEDQSRAAKAEEEKISAKLSQTYLGKVTSSSSQTITTNGSDSQFLAPAPSIPSKVKTKSYSSKSHHHHHATPVAIAPKPVELSGRKTVSKKSSHRDDYTCSTTCLPPPPPSNDFKSLRSNDIRYSQYSVTTTTSTPAATPYPPTKIKVKAEKSSSKCDIVVSIPHNQMQDEWESKPLSQLKTASKKSPNSASQSSNFPFGQKESHASSLHLKKVKNVPKLKIELNSLRTKLIEKPKSADIRLDSLIIKNQKPRRLSWDEKPSTDKVDLETYAKNIGLKPIEVQTSGEPPEATEKFTPNASPRSSCSSSTTSSSNGHLNMAGTEMISTSSSSSSHKKRKKKHSKDSKDSRDSKRKKMHAEISSRGADESLKMKVKLTAPLNIKPSKFESKKSSAPVQKIPHDPLTLTLSKSLPTTPVVAYEKSSPLPSLTIIKPLEEKSPAPPPLPPPPPPAKDTSPSMEKSFKNALKLKPLAIKTCAKDFEDEDDDDIVMAAPDASTALSLSKPLTNLKDDTLPHSPPLPPSLFKTTPITFSTFTPGSSNNIAPATVPPAAVAPKPSKPPLLAPKPIKEKFTQPIKMKPLAPKPMPIKPIQSSIKPPQFAVPNLPRLMPNNGNKFHTSTPTSIASSANKQMGNLLKRSMSADDSKLKANSAGSASVTASASSSPSPSFAKQPKLDRPHQITVSAYGSNLQVTKVDVPATPTSSTAKATFEIPLYSPLSASYNPKCSFSVTSASAATNNNNKAKGKLSLSINTNKGGNSLSKSPPAFSNSVAADKDIIMKSSMPTNHSSANKPPISSLMGPPLPLAKLSTVVPTAVKSPPLGSVLPLNCSKSYSLGLSGNSSGGPRPLMAKAAACLPLEKRTDGILAAAAAANTNGGSSGKSSLRQFRLPSREAGQEILDLSAAVNKNSSTTPKTSTSQSFPGVGEKKSPGSCIPLSPTATAGTSLEMALSKIKQNMQQQQQQQQQQQHQSMAANQDITVKGLEFKPNSDDLQNLQLLSESATAREKIAIMATTASATASTSTSSSSASTSSSSSSASSLYEMKPKINQNTLVRQQNASVRNIPNPSALAFRNHHQQPSINIPMVQIAVPLLTSLSNEVDKSNLLSSSSSTTACAAIKTSTTNSPVSPPTTSSTSPTRGGSGSSTILPGNPLLYTKKHPSIDQVAANLNIRATAAAAAANLKQLDETLTTSTVTSSSEIPSAENQVKQIKQESPEQSAITANHEVAQSPASFSSTSSSSYSLANSCSAASSSSSSSSLLLKENYSSQIIPMEIKQEPGEEKFPAEEQQQREIRPAAAAAAAAAVALPTSLPAMVVVKTTSASPSTMATTQTKSMQMTSQQPVTLTKVENLVTSVINVSTPSSSLLTTSGVGF